MTTVIGVPSTFVRGYNLVDTLAGQRADISWPLSDRHCLLSLHQPIDPLEEGLISPI